jgi:oligoribonuclease NrnB/cAMP/cGMP phosphodiesterase (DHH superfamily)
MAFPYGLQYLHLDFNRKVLSESNTFFDIVNWIEDKPVGQLARDGESLPIEENDADPQALFDERIMNMDEADAILLTDCTDADGLGCGVLFRHKYGNDVVILPAGHGYWGPDPHTAFANIGAYAPRGTPIYVTDLGQNESNREKWIKAVTNVAQNNSVHFRDHHETPSDLRASLDGLYNVEYTHDSEVCATMNVLETDYPDAPEYLKKFAEYTNARDLYLTDEEEFDKGEILTNAAFWLPMEEYITAAVEHGVNIQQHEKFGEVVEKRTELRDAKLDWVMETQSLHEINGVMVGVVYGDCYHSEAGRRLLEEEGCDIAVIIKPSGKVSWRTTEDYAIANELADSLGGGGHPTAAGCSPFGSVTIEENERKIEHASQEREELLSVVESMTDSK